jgi:hypothetical protein
MLEVVVVGVGQLSDELLVLAESDNSSQEFSVMINVSRKESTAAYF